MRKLAGADCPCSPVVFRYCAPLAPSAQDRVRIGVPFFPTVSYPVYIAHEKGFFERTA